MMRNVERLGQVFTPPDIVSLMLNLRRNYGTTLEPSAGNGAFFSQIPDCVGIEIDARYCGPGMVNADFFDISDTVKFDTIIGNPPYVRFRDIIAETKEKLNVKIFDRRSNLYLFFIEKCLRHLNSHGEIIFITPRDFSKATSSRKLNKILYESGTMTDFIDLGDRRVFGDFSPNCCIWRFEKDNFSHKMSDGRRFIFNDGQLFFADKKYPLNFCDIFFVKVGAVSGCDEIFTDEQYGDTDFVYSETIATKRTRRMLFNASREFLLPYKERLLSRKIKQFSEKNWWEWGRIHYMSERPRIYVNCKTRKKNPFFVHSCTYYDGSVLAVFPHDENADIHRLCNALNAVPWSEMGFVCDGRFLFSQRSLENAPLPAEFVEFIPKLAKPMSK